MVLLFWSLIALIAYIYIGYGILLLLLVKIKKKKPLIPQLTLDELPEVTLVVAAWNEEEVIQSKIENTMEMDYPEEKVHFIIISDGSDDRTVEIVKKHPHILLLHKKTRKGKTAALNRAIDHVKTPIVIFSDANAMLNKEAFREIVKHYKNPKVGCVAGEKRIILTQNEHGVSFGEGAYWKYESFLKKNDAKLHSCVGAAGELFSIKTDLFDKLPPDTILDDFIISLKVAMKGYTIAYEPQAYAIEFASQTVAEEMKRKVRISAGGIQSVIRLRPLLNLFKYGLLSFQYISHRVLRWTLGPAAIILLLPLNFYLALSTNQVIYQILFFAQLVFYLYSFLGYWFDRNNKKVTLFYIPFYFLVMNFCVISGLFRLLKGNQSVNWERSTRTSF